MSDQNTYWYQCQERAMAPCISDGWPPIIDAPHTPNGRLKRMEGDPLARIAELEARNAELEGVALKTADGVLLTDGMEVWIPNANGVLGGPTEKRTLTTKRLLYSERDAYGRVGARLGCCYSTHQAAEAARGKGVENV